MPDDFKDYKTEVRSIMKVNKSMDALNLIPLNKESSYTSANIYINDMYEHYVKTEDLQEVLQTAASRMEQAMKEAPVWTPTMDM